MNIGNEFKKFANSNGITTTFLNDYTNYQNFQNTTPNVVEERKLNASVIDVFSRLMMDRVIFLGTGIDDQIANIVVAQLLFLESLDAKKDITIYINSPGGSVYAGLGIYDTMQLVKPDVATICTSLAASMGAVLMVAGAKGKRSALKHSRIMMHQPMGGVAGGTQYSDMEINLTQMKGVKNDLYNIISEHSGQTVEKIEADCNRDFWLKAEEAKEYGIVDEVLKKL